jgi:hypothetical protein
VLQGQPMHLETLSEKQAQSKRTRGTARVVVPLPKGKP